MHSQLAMSFFSETAEAGSPDAGRSVIVGLWVRRFVLAAFAVLVLLALLDQFGQQPSRSVAAAPAATLRLSAPEAVRGGLLFQSRIDIRTRRTVRFPRLVLGEGWTEGMQVNSINPAPSSESSRDGRLVLSYDQLNPGDLFVIWLQFQVDPINVGTRSYAVELDDETTALARVERSITIFP
jgi:hypothetical protein